MCAQLVSFVRGKVSLWLMRYQVLTKHSCEANFQETIYKTTLVHVQCTLLELLCALPAAFHTFLLSRYSVIHNDRNKNLDSCIDFEYKQLLFSDFLTSSIPWSAFSFSSNTLVHKQISVKIKNYIHSH